MSPRRSLPHSTCQRGTTNDFAVNRQGGPFFLSPAIHKRWGRPLILANDSREDVPPSFPRSSPRLLNQL